MKYFTTLMLLLSLASIGFAQTAIEFNLENKTDGAYIGNVALEIGSTFYLGKLEVKAKNEQTPSSGGFISPTDAVDWMINQSNFSVLDWTGYELAKGWNDDGTTYQETISNAAWQLTEYSIEIQPFNGSGNVGSPIVAAWADYTKKEVKAEYKAEKCGTAYDSTTAEKWKSEAKIKVEKPASPTGVAIDQAADSLLITVKNAANENVFTYTASIEWVNPALFGLNIETTFSAPANNSFYVPTETFTATIILTNDAGDVLSLANTDENKVEKLDFWISGPKQYYKNIPEYEEIKVVDKYVVNPESGFDTTSNSVNITLSDTLNLEEGTYTFLVKAKRKGFGPEVEKYLLTDFQVKTETVSTNPTEEWAIGCATCHELEKHGATEVRQCVVCHTKAFEKAPAFVGIIHEHHATADQPILACETCHTNSMGNDDASSLACGTCHNGTISGTFPESHASFTDEMCASCHASGDKSPDQAHANLTAIESQVDSRPSKYQLAQNYPNPFNPETSIEFSVANREHVQLDIYNISGQKIVTLIDQIMEQGSHTIHWNAAQLPSGIYIYRLKTNNALYSRKMMLLK